MGTTSAKEFMAEIRIPTLAINAQDDPLLPGSKLPYAKAMASSYLAMAVTERGGHVGFYDADSSRRWCFRVSDQWIQALQDADTPARPRPVMVADHGFLYPEGFPGMAFMEVSSFGLKMLTKQVL